jgi:PAS domain-containing protein
MGLARFEAPTSVLLHGSPRLLEARSGWVFVLASGGLRRLHGGDSTFLGYSAREMFWRDVLELVHERDLPHAEDLICEVVENPGTSLSTRLRFLDASGGWRFMETSFQNVLEAPGDVGLVIADVREADPDAFSATDGASFTADP